MSAHSGPNIVEDGLVLAVDPANQKSYSSNMFQYATDFYSFTPSVTAKATSARDNVYSPVGNTPLKLTQVDIGAAYTPTYNNSAWNIAPAANGETWTVSFWIKSNFNSGAGQGRLYVFGANSAGLAYVAPDYVNIFSGTYTATTDWQRISKTVTFTNPDVNYIQFRLDTTYDAPIGGITWFDGFQVERTASASQFNPNYYGAVVNDISRNNNNGVIVGPPLFNDSNKGCLEFDYSIKYIDLSNTIPDSYLNSNSWTFTIWANFDSFPTASPFSYILSHGATSTNNGLHFRSSTLNRVRFGLYGNDIDSTSSLSENTWYNIAFVFDYSNSLKKIYINGELDSSGGTVGYSGTGSNLLIGRAWSNIAQYFDGLLGPINFYTHAFSDDEVRNNFNALRGRYGI